MEAKMMDLSLDELEKIFGSGEQKPRMSDAQVAAFLRDCQAELTANQHTFTPGQLVTYTLGNASPNVDPTAPMLFIGYLEDEGRDVVYGYDFAHSPNEVGDAVAGMRFDCRVVRVAYSHDGNAFFAPKMANSRELSPWRGQI